MASGPTGTNSSGPARALLFAEESVCSVTPTERPNATTGTAQVPRGWPQQGNAGHARKMRSADDLAKPPPKELTSAAHTRDARMRRHGNSFEAILAQRGCLGTHAPCCKACTPPPDLPLGDVRARAHMVRRGDTRGDFQCRNIRRVTSGQTNLDWATTYGSGVRKDTKTGSTQKACYLTSPPLLKTCGEQRHSAPKDIDSQRAGSPLPEPPPSPSPQHIYRHTYTMVLPS